jgi:hypothetical protein
VTRLEDLTINTAIRGVVPDALVTVVATKWFGSGTLELTYKEPASKLASEILFRDREPTLEVVTVGRPRSFDGDGAQFRLVPEARRIRLAHLFDPVLAVHTSLVDPLPHQITAVYDASSGQYSGCRPGRSVPEPSGDTSLSGHRTPPVHGLASTSSFIKNVANTVFTFRRRS